MTKIKKTWVAVVMGALLLGTLVGVVWARPNDRPEAQDITRKITVPAAFFQPNQDGSNWHNGSLWVRMLSGDGYFTAPVIFPCLPSVTVERLILYAWDANGSVNACAYLNRTRPQHGDQKQMASICSGGTTTAVQPFTTTNINPDVVWPSHGVYIWLHIGGPDIYVYTVRVEYHRNL